MNKVDHLPFPSGHFPESHILPGLMVWCLAIAAGFGVWFGFIPAI